MDRRRVLACLAAGASGCGRKNGSGPRKVRVSLIPRVALAPVYLADELGFFKEAGLELDIRQLPESPQMIPLLAGGKLDVAFGGASAALINAVTKGARVRIVASRDIVAPNCGVAGTIWGSRRAFPNGLRDIRLLKGKRVAVTSRTSSTAFFLDLYLESVGMSAGEVQVLTMRAPESTAALAGGKIDALAWGAFENDVAFTSANFVRGPSAADFVPNFQYTFVLYGPSLLDHDAETGVRFLEAYLRGVEAFMSGKTPRIFDQLAAATRSNPAAARSACRQQFSSDGRVDRSSVQRYADWAVKKGFVPAPVDAAALIETRYVEEALRRLDRRKAGER